MLGAKDIRFATEEEVEEITGGVKPGAVPPFGNLFGLEVIADITLYDNEKIVFNAGERTFSVAMKSEDYKRLVGHVLKVLFEGLLHRNRYVHAFANFIFNLSQRLTASRVPLL